MQSRSIFALALLLASCGGGGSEAPADSGPAAYYSDFSFREGRLLSLMVFNGGLAYGFYQSDYSAPVFPEFVYAGFFVVTTSNALDVPATYRGTDFNFDAKSASAATLTVTDQRTTSLSGDLTASGGGSGDSINAGSASVAMNPTVTATLGGTYAGYIRSIDGGAHLAANLTGAGQLSATTTDGGCTISATLNPRELGNLYDTQATVGMGCPSPAGNYRGHSFQSYLTRNVYVMLTADGVKHGVFMQLFDPPTPTIESLRRPAAGSTAELSGRVR